MTTSVRATEPASVPVGWTAFCEMARATLMPASGSREIRTPNRQSNQNKAQQ